MPKKAQKLIKPNFKGNYPILTRFRIEVCPDEGTMVWTDSGMTPPTLADAEAFIRANVPKHIMSRIVVEAMQVVKLYYSEPGYIK